MRDAIDSEYAGSPLFPLLLTSLIEAADRVDSTTGVQMAYVKQWAPRSAKPLELRVPELLDGPGRAIQGDAVELTSASAPRPARDWGTSTWRTWIRRTTSTGISPTTTCGRRWWPGTRPRPTAWPASGSMPGTHPPAPSFNSKRTMPAALASVVQSVDCDLLVLSYNNESWLGLEELEAMCSIRAGSDGRPATAAAAADEVATLAFDSARYVGARIGIFDPSGRKVGRVSHLSNQELVVIAGEPALVRRVVEAVGVERTIAAPVAATGAASDAAPAVVAAGLVGSATTGNVSKHDHGGHDSGSHDGVPPRRALRQPDHARPRAVPTHERRRPAARLYVTR